MIKQIIVMQFVYRSANITCKLHVISNVVNVEKRKYIKQVKQKNKVIIQNVLYINT